MKIPLGAAILAINPNADISVTGDIYEGVLWFNGTTPIPKSEVQAKLAELQSAEPIRLLREKRNVLLAETDWWASTDLVISVPRKAYRQALRDLPTGLTTEFKVKNVKWPTAPG